MSESIITDPNAVANYLDEIRALADANKSALGFLPPRAYHDACMRGRLWVAIDDGGKLSGYLFFGGCYPRLRVFQILVRPDFRYSGIARNLLRKLRKYGENHNYLTITARVAEDLEANTFWKAIGFVITQRIARDTTKRSLNRYTLELDVPSLFRGQPSCAADAAQIRFPQPLLPTPSYVIDLNVFLDVVQSRDDGESSLVLSMGFDHEISLFVTSELVKELERHTAGRSQDPVLKFARRLPTLPSVDSETVKPLVEDLRIVLQTGTPKTGRRVANDASDLNQLAFCIHHRAYGFVTRDAALLRRSDDLRRKYDLSIISPADFSDLFDDDAVRHEPLQATVDQLDVRIADLDERDRSEVEKFFRDLGIDPRQISSCLAPGTTQHPRLRRIVRVGPGLVGVGSWDGPGPRGARNVHLYVKEDEPGAERAIDRLFLESMSASSHGRLRRLDLNIAPRQEKTREVAVNVGFRPPKHGGDSSGALTKVSFMGVVGKENWSSFRRTFKNMTDFALQDDMPSWEALSNPDIVLIPDGDDDGRVTIPLFDFETLVSPCALICPGRTGVMVPIKAVYARELIATTEPQRSLLPDREATLRLERAYFLGAGKHRILPRGTIVVFYVSSPRSEAVALARVTFSDTLTKDQAVLKLKRQGVLTRNEINQNANLRGEIAAFTFDNLLAFQKPIPFHELKQAGCISPANLVTAEALTHQALVRIVSRAFGVKC